MPSIICAVKDCQSTNDTLGVLFYKFPNDKESCDKWLEILNCPDLKGSSLHNYQVCSLHFENNEFTNDYLIKSEDGKLNDNYEIFNEEDFNFDHLEYIDVLELEHNFNNEDLKFHQNFTEKEVDNDNINYDSEFNNNDNDMMRILEKERMQIVRIDGIGYVRLYFEPPEYFYDDNNDEDDDKVDYEEADDDDDNNGETKKEFFKCAHCGAQFQDFNFLKIHVHQHSLNKNICSNRGKFREFKKAYALQMTNNLNNSKRLAQNSNINSIFPKYGINQILNRSIKDHQCSIGCNKRLINVSEFRNHTLSPTRQTGVLPFICPVCNRRFARLPCLNNHIQAMHSNVKFGCSLCGKSYMNEHYLKVHLHLHANKLMYQCTVCHKPFVDQPALKLHMRTHTGERPFVCSVCNRAFTQQSHLKTHLRLHTGEKPFNCDLCEKSFRQISNLIEHRRRHDKNSLTNKTSKSQTPVD